MYTQRITHYPAVGKTGDLRAALLERNAQSSAVPHSLASRMFSTEPAFIHNIMFDNLAALEAYQDRTPDAAFLATGAKIEASLGRPRATALYEILVPRQGSGPAKYRQHIRHFVKLDQVAEARKLLEERVHATIPGRIGAVLHARVWPPDGPCLVVTHLFGSLAGVDDFRAASQDAASQAFFGKVAGLCTRSSPQSIERVLVPYPAR